MKIENLSMKTRKIIALMMAVALALSCLAGCGAKGEPATEDAGGNDANAGTITITDHADKQVEVPTEINRIAVCDIFPIPSVLAVFFDSADKIVGMPEPSKTAAENGLLGQLYPEILNAETGYIDGSNVNMEELAKLEGEYDGKLQLIGVPIDVDFSKPDSENYKDALMIMEKAGVEYKNISLDGSLMEYAKTMQYVPTSIFVDPDGNIVGEPVVGGDFDKYRETIESNISK